MVLARLTLVTLSLLVSTPAALRAQGVPTPASPDAPALPDGPVVPDTADAEAAAAPATGASPAEPARDAEPAGAPIDTPAGGSEGARAALLSARAHFARGNHMEAMVNARRAAELDPELLEARVIEGRSLMAMKAYPEAAQALGAATVIDGGIADLWVLLGDAHAGADSSALARESYQRALAIDANHALARGRIVELRRRDDAKRITAMRQARLQRRATAEPPPRDWNRGRPRVERYGGLVGGMWAASILTLGAIYANSDDPPPIGLLVGVPPAIVHFAHGNVGYGLLDLVALQLSIIVGAVGGAVLCPRDSAEACIGMIVIGGLGGMIAWPIIDATVLAKREVPRTDYGLRLVPVRGGGTLALDVSF